MVKESNIDMQTFQFDWWNARKNHYFSIIKAVIKEGITRGHDVFVLFLMGFTSNGLQNSIGLGSYASARKNINMAWYDWFEKWSIMSKFLYINKLLWNEFVEELAPDFILFIFFLYHGYWKIWNKCKFS